MDLPHSTTLRLAVPEFDWHTLILAHGWVHLAPFQWDADRAALACNCDLGDSAAGVILRTAPSGDRRRVTATLRSARPTDQRQRDRVRAQVRRILRLDEDFSAFQQSCRADPLLRFVHERRCGGMLRGASAFEDVIKTVCTVNCDWRNTKSMCKRLCEMDHGAFPSPARLLRHSERSLATRIRCGYRARTVRALARLFDDGRLPLDDWAQIGDFERIRAQLGSVWGIGPYALSHILVLLGDYSTIPVDSEVLKYLRVTHFAGSPVSAREAVVPYERFGRFRFLAYKFARIARRLNYIDK